MDPTEQLERYLDDVCRTPATRLALRRHILQLANKITADARDKAAEATRHGFDTPRIPSRDEAINQAIRDFTNTGVPVRSEFVLKQLVKFTTNLLAVIDWMGRPFLHSEVRAWRFVLLEWEAASIKAEILCASEEDKEYYLELLGQLREVFHPDPVRQIRLHRVRAEHVAKKCSGNNATLTEPFEGMSVRRLTTKEVIERTRLLSKLSGNIVSLVNELSMVRSRDRVEAKQIARTSRKLVQHTRAFAERCERAPVPSRAPSLEESLEQMRVMNGLMEAVAG